MKLGFTIIGINNPYFDKMSFKYHQNNVHPILKNHVHFFIPGFYLMYLEKFGHLRQNNQLDLK